jgi:hypothetical protein
MQIDSRCCSLPCLLLRDHLPSDVGAIALNTEGSAALYVGEIRHLVFHLSIDRDLGRQFLSFSVDEHLHQSCAEPARILRRPADAPLFSGDAKEFRVLGPAARPLTYGCPIRPGRDRGRGWQWSNVRALYDSFSCRRRLLVDSRHQHNDEDDQRNEAQNGCAKTAQPDFCPEVHGEILIRPGKDACLRRWKARWAAYENAAHKAKIRPSRKGSSLPLVSLRRVSDVPCPGISAFHARRLSLVAHVYGYQQPADERSRCRCEHPWKWDVQLQWRHHKRENCKWLRDKRHRIGLLGSSPQRCCQRRAKGVSDSLSAAAEVARTVGHSGYPH